MAAHAHQPTTAGEFLDRLYDFDHDGWLNLFTVNFATGDRQVHWARTPHELATLAADLDDCNTWFGVATRREHLAGRRGGNRDCLLIPAVWVDIDIAGPNHPDNERLPATIDEARQLLYSYPLAPTVVVDTGGGLQAWWKFTEPVELAEHPDLLERWHATWAGYASALDLHIDNVFDPARVMRLPGSYNHKTDPPRPVTILDADWGRSYGLDDVDQWLIDPPPMPAAEERIPYIGPGRPGDAYNARHSGPELLERLGFVVARADRNGDRHYTRPGKEKREGTSATVYADDGHTTIWSDTCQQSWPTIQTRRPYDPFGLYVHTHHGGDYTTASRHLLKQGYGDPVEQIDPDTMIGDTLRGAEAAGDELDPLLAQLVDWTTFWAKDHKAEEWLAWPLVAAGRQTALFAPAKTGKSILTLAAVAALATGRPIFGGERQPPRHVLYLDYEMTEADLYERLEALGYGPDEDLSHLHYALLPSLPPLNTAEGSKALCRLADLVGAEVVVIDTMGRAVEGEENASDTYMDFATVTGLPLKRAGRAVLRTDHAGKAKDKGQRGSSAKNDDVDIVYRLDPAQDGYLLSRTHTRIAWAPDKVAITRSEDEDGQVEFRAKRAQRMFAPGTVDLAATLDEIGVPLDATRREAGVALKAATGSGKRAKNVQDALHYRRQNAGIEDVL